jgi:lysophospholipase L1-like esterase
MLKTIIYLLGITSLLLAQGNNKDIPDPDPNRFKEEVDYFNWYDSKNSFPEDAVLFVGSSSIRFWETVKYFPNNPVINRGFGGAHISDVIFFIDTLVIKYKPQIIVFYCGDNDMAAEKNAERVFNDYKEFVRLVKKDLPETKILYIPIKPSLDRWSRWSDMRVANELILKFSETDRYLHYIDTATPMLNEKSLPDPSLFVEDGLHLNAKGYELWTKILMPDLDKTYNDM